jgi:hypothetical protein
MTTVRFVNGMEKQDGKHQLPLGHCIIYHKHRLPMETNEIIVTPSPSNALTKSAKSNIPVDESILSDVALTASKQWSLDSSLTLKWITCVQFSEMAQNYAQQLTDRDKEKETRPQLSKRLKELDMLIDDNIEYVKGYISEDVNKSNAVSYFPQFGIQKIGTGYRLPFDRNNRLQSLKKLLSGLQERGYADKKYGLGFWQSLMNEYETKLTIIDQMDRNLTGQVAPKQNNKVQVKKVLKALIAMLQANYPDTYVSELRKWGFQKEKY